MFSGCVNFLYLNLTTFNITILGKMENMFQNCLSLIYLDLGDIKIKNISDKNFILESTNEDIKICAEDPKTIEMFTDNDLTVNCSDDCFQNKSIALKSKKTCVDTCEEDEIYKYEYSNTCMDKCPKGTHHIYRHEYLCQKDVKCKVYKINIAFSF